MSPDADNGAKGCRREPLVSPLNRIFRDQITDARRIQGRGRRVARTKRLPCAPPQNESNGILFFSSAIARNIICRIVRRDRKCYPYIVPSLKVQVNLAEWEETLNEKTGKRRVLAAFKPALKRRSWGRLNVLEPSKDSTYQGKAFRHFSLPIVRHYGLSNGNIRECF